MNSESFSFPDPFAPSPRPREATEEVQAQLEKIGATFTALRRCFSKEKSRTNPITAQQLDLMATITLKVLEGWGEEYKYWKTRASGGAASSQQIQRFTELSEDIPTLEDAVHKLGVALEEAKQAALNCENSLTLPPLPANQKDQSLIDAHKELQAQLKDDLSKLAASLEQLAFKFAVFTKKVGVQAATASSSAESGESSEKVELPTAGYWKEFLEALVSFIENLDETYVFYNVIDKSFPLAPHPRVGEIGEVSMLEGSEESSQEESKESLVDVQLHKEESFWLAAGRIIVALWKLQGAMHSWASSMEEAVKFTIASDQSMRNKSSKLNISEAEQQLNEWLSAAQNLKKTLS